MLLKYYGNLILSFYIDNLILWSRESAVLILCELALQGSRLLDDWRVMTESVRHTRAPAN